MAERKGIKYGAIYGVLLIFIFCISTMLFALYSISETKSPEGTFEVLSILFSSITFIIGVIISFLFLFILGLFLVIKDRDVAFTFKNYLPLFLAVLYAISPFDFPGPVDDVIVLSIAGFIQTFFLVKRYNLIKDLPEDIKKQHMEKILKDANSEILIDDYKQGKISGNDLKKLK